MAVTNQHSSIYLICQLICGAVFPGRPVANMVFVTYGYISSAQGIKFAADLKLGQYVKLPPRSTFSAQMAGSIIGCILNYTIMRSIVAANAEVLRDPSGTRVWSGWIIQSYNSASVAMGALAKELFT